MEWSSVSDAPSTLGMSLEEFTNYYRSEYGEAGMQELPDRLARVEAKGVSSHAPDEDLDDFLRSNRAGDNEEMLSRREILIKYCPGAVVRSIEQEVRSDEIDRQNRMLLLTASTIKRSLSAAREPVDLSELKEKLKEQTRLWKEMREEKIDLENSTTATAGPIETVIAIPGFGIVGGGGAGEARVPVQSVYLDRAETLNNNLHIPVDRPPVPVSQLLAQAIPIVQRTAKVGLVESLITAEQRARWFYIWCGDVAGEMGEVWDFVLQDDLESDAVLTEVGDVLWGITALVLLCDIPIAAFEGHYPCGNSWEAAISKSLELIEIGKKTCRDGIQARPIDLERVTNLLLRILQTLTHRFNMERALHLVDVKLQKRYPNGFSVRESVDRAI